MGWNDIQPALLEEKPKTLRLVLLSVRNLPFLPWNSLLFISICPDFFWPPLIIFSFILTVKNSNFLKYDER
jgi:hypothetical protein